MVLNIRRFRGVGRLMPGLMASLAVTGLIKLNAWVPLERTFNNQMMLWRGSSDWDSRIVMISIDDRTLDAFGQYPLGREHYADLLRRLTQENVGVVAINVLFVDPTSGPNRASSSTVNARLAGAMKTFGKVIIAQAWNEQNQALLPVPVLADTAIAVGHVQVQPDSDGIARRIALTWQGIPALGVATVQAYGLQKELVSIPTDLSEMRINWPSSAYNLPTLSLVDVLNGQYPQGALANKIVIVSYDATATAGQVELRTPFDQKDSIPGGYLHAAVVDTLLKQNWLRSVSENALIAFILLGGSTFGMLLYRRRPVTQLLMGGGLFAGWLVICVVALYAGYLLPVVPPLATLLLVGASVTWMSRLQANALLQVRSAFLNTMSHEIRTPLNAIVNLSEMLQETRLDSHQREFTETLNNSSQVLLALINDVLDFSKIESGRLMIEAYPVRLSDIVERSLEMLAPKAAEKGLEMVYSIAPETPAVIMSDPVRLQQILLNLLSNAVKFTETGEISVQVQASVVSANRSMFSLRRLNLSQWMHRDHKAHLASTSVRRASLGEAMGGAIAGGKAMPSPAHAAPFSLYEIRFAVHDTGIGIPAERLSQLFRPFSQVSAATTRKYGGTGLGLSISKRLSERMGGDLWVRSYFGEGSTFYFTVQAPLAESSQTPPSYLRGLGGTRLLLVDRNITRRDQLTWELQPLGIRLSQATSLSEALTFMQNDPMFDGIIFDEAIACDQVECAIAIRALRQAARNDHLPVILLSRLQASAEQTATAERINDTAVIWKPVKQAALHQALRSISPATLAMPVKHPALSPSEACASRPSNAGASTADSANIQEEAHTLADESRCARLNILIAEDNAINQRVALRLLELLGYRADVAASGREVLAALDHQRYDVILMDMRMPDLDGIETTRQIRQMPEHTDTWIIAMTANAMTRDQRRCFAAGMNDYLSKPINRQALDQALRGCPAMKRD
ncbi:MAG: CHASE2 domain-containing protein [Phormidesmis sp.]